MGKQNVAKVNFNVGVIDTDAIARTDIQRGQLSAEVQENWTPRTLGSMALRAGTVYIGNTYNNEEAYHIPFVYSAADTAMLELTERNMRVLIDAVPITRDAVTTSVTNGGFDNDITGWTNQSDTGGQVYHTHGDVPIGLSQITNFNERAIKVKDSGVAAAVDWPIIESLLAKYAPGVIPGTGARTSYFDAHPEQNNAAFSEARAKSLLGFGDPYSTNFNERLQSVAGLVSPAHWQALLIIADKYDSTTIPGKDENGVPRRTKYFNENPADNAAAFNEAQSLSIPGFSLGSSSGAGYLGMRGTGYNQAAVTQRVVVTDANKYKRHGLRIKIGRGKVRLRLGSFVAGDPYFPEITLRSGVYSFGFVPRSDFSITFINYESVEALIESVQIELAGDLVIPTEWNDIKSVRYVQSADVVFMACHLVHPKRIVRYNRESWGIEEYDVEDGAFRPINTSKNKLSINELSGNATLTSERPMFKDGHIGALFSITSSSQGIAVNLAGEDQWSPAVRVTGLTEDREFSYTISGTWTTAQIAQITLQRSIGDDQNWADTGRVHKSNGTYTLNDTRDNQEIYYRLGIATGQYTLGSGATVSISIESPQGGITGICRVINVQNSNIAGVEVLRPFGSIEATTLWSEGKWSGVRGYPTAVGFMDGRLWWAGNDDILGSVSDNYHSFDANVEGDSAPILRSLGYGAVDRVNWILALQRLVIGTESDERTARSSSLDEPLTPANFNMKSASSQGSANVDAVVLDEMGIFVDSSYRRIFQLEQNQSYDYSSQELSLLVPSLFAAGVRRIAVQRKPNTRIHCVMRDGRVNILTYDKAEDVKCWTTFATKGQVEDVVILPRQYNDDAVYYVVHRALDYDGFPIDFNFAYSGSGRVMREVNIRMLGYDGAFHDGMADAWLLKVFGSTDVDALINEGKARGVGLPIDKSQLYYGNGRNSEEAAYRVLGYNAGIGQESEKEWLWTRYGTRDINDVYNETIDSAPYYGDGRSIQEIGLRYIGYTGVINGTAETSWLMTNYETTDVDVALYKRASLTNRINFSQTDSDTTLYRSARYLERVAADYNCIGGVVNKLADSNIEFSASTATNIITGLSHLNGHHVCVWGNKKYLGVYLVAAGQITISESVTYAVVGLPYAAYYKSAKLAYASELGTALGQKKKVGGVGFILKNTHAQGLQYGSDLSYMQNLPMAEDGAVVPYDKIWAEYDKVRVPMPHSYDTDSRLYLSAYAPRPCTVVASIITVETNDKI